MKKVIGYVLLFVGLATLILSYEAVQTALGITLPPPLTKATLLPASAIIIVFGAFVAFRAGSSRKKVTEVPIYHDKEIVGYRRIHR